MHVGGFWLPFIITPGRSAFFAVPDPLLPLRSEIFRAYIILGQVNDLSAEAYYSLIDNLKIVQYETKSNFEAIENIYYVFTILKNFVCCFPVVLSFIQQQTQWSNLTDIVVSWFSMRIQTALSVCVCEHVCVHLPENISMFGV